MGKRTNPRAEQLRQALAQEAARIMSEQGISDFLLAKRKAAERLGVTDIAVLPRNIEIENALQERQRLFSPDSHNSLITAMRLTALRAMQLLSEFQPRLVGPVLSGTASAHTEISLHLFSDHAESVALQLVDRGIPHELAEKRVRFEPNRSVTYPAVRFMAGNRAIEAVVFPFDGIRQAPCSPLDGRPMRRADATEIESLLAMEQDLSEAAR